MSSTERDQRLLILEQIIENRKKKKKQTEMAVKSVFAPNKNMLLTACSFTFNA